MGQNRRYGSDVTRAVVADVVIRPVPVSLSAVEVGTDITRTDDPVRVAAWVPFRTEQTAQVDARVIAYTDTACQIEFTTRAGAQHQVWVWRGAVKLETPRGTERRVHPLLTSYEPTPGEWWLGALEGAPYSIVKMIRRGDQLGCRAVTYAERSEDRQLIDYFVRLSTAAERAHDHVSRGAGRPVAARAG